MGSSLIASDGTTENKMCFDISSKHSGANLKIIKNDCSCHNYEPYQIKFYKDWIRVRHNNQHIWYNMSDVSQLIEQNPDAPIDPKDTYSCTIDIKR